MFINIKNMLKFFFMGSIVFNIFGQDIYGEYRSVQEYPIDKQLDECMSKDDIGNAGMGNCWCEAVASWDREIDKYYKLLMGILEPGERKKLKLSQVRWRKYVKSEETFLYQTSFSGGGSFDITADPGFEAEIYKDRALRLMAYYKEFHSLR